VELSQELEDEFKVPLPPIVAWNYPTPAALARYLAEQSLGAGNVKGEAVAPPPASSNVPSANPQTGGSHSPANDQRLADLLAEIENLSEEEAARLLADERRQP
jgi:hypothetical protein